MILNNNTLEILENFTKDINENIYGRYISRKLKMNQKTVSNILNKLEKENILKFSIEGKNKYYFLNKANSNIKEIIKIIEINKKIKLTEKYKKFKDLFNQLESKIGGILVIFGSYANFSSNEKSDLDLLVIGKNENVKDLERLYNIKINVVKIEKNKFNKEDILIKEIVKNHVLLKGVEEFTELIWLI
ncbi:MAG: nucleotidyltransferase domain-containing protein [Nanoarchaeota archaeon]